MCESSKATGRGSRSGFSMVELLVVMGLIGIMVSISFPALSRYIRLYRIRAAATQVTGEIQAARSRAIMKNVNLGVVFVVLSSTTYRWVIEDDLRPPVGATRLPLSELLASPSTPNPDITERQGPLRELPKGIVFGSGCTTSPTFTQNGKGFRFNRLGIWCMPDASNTTCPAIDAGSTLIMNDTASSSTGTTLCLQQQNTNFRLVLNVASGGRVTTR